MNQPVWFWTTSVSPHWASLYKSLLDQGISIKIIAETAGPTHSRRQLGWPESFPDLPVVTVRTAEVRSLVASAPPDAIHICSRLDARSVCGRARKLLARAGRRQFAAIETVDDGGILGPLKRIKYRILIAKKQRQLLGILASGRTTRDWLIARGARPDTVYPFAYFLDEPASNLTEAPTRKKFKFSYVGQLIRRKRVDLLIRAFAKANLDADLQIVGSGPESERLHRLAEQITPGRVKFRPVAPIADIPAIIREADCLVLPSRFDGWGAVIVEALMVGTPVICSDRCGASMAVAKSGGGLIFRSGRVADLTDCLRAAALRRDLFPDRSALREWSRCFAGASGADYLLRILREGQSGRNIRPPWDQAQPGFWPERSEKIVPR